jgi:hypothetical protein
MIHDTGGFSVPGRVSSVHSVTSPNHYALLYSDNANTFDSEVVARSALPVPVSVRVTETPPSILEMETCTAPEPGIGQ